MGSILQRLQSVDPDEALAYTTVKFVRIRDRRLGALHYLLMIGIIAYILGFEIIHQRRYLRTEPPYGTIRATALQPDNWVPAASLPYCSQNQSSYKGFNNSECVYLLGLDLTYPPALVDSLFVTTRIKDSFYHITGTDCPPSSLPNKEECAPNLSIDPDETRYYTAGVEDYTIYMEHAIFGRQNGIMVSNSDCKGELRFRKSKKKIKFDDPSRGGDVVTLKTLLEAANVPSLDQLSEVKGGKSLRYDGTMLIAVVEYGNQVSNSKKFFYHYDVFHIPGVDVLAMQPSATEPGGLRQRNWYGVRIVFLVVGMVGHFDFASLLVAIVSGTVLVKMATVVVDMMLLYVLPDKTIYKQHKYEVTEDFGDLRTKRMLDKQQTEERL